MHISGKQLVGVATALLVGACAERKSSRPTTLAETDFAHADSLLGVHVGQLVGRNEVQKFRAKDGSTITIDRSGANFTLSRETEPDSASEMWTEEYTYSGHSLNSGRAQLWDLTATSFGSARLWDDRSANPVEVRNLVLALDLNDKLTEEAE